MQPPSKKHLSNRAKSLRESTKNILKQQLWAKILLGMILGIIVGYILSPHGMAIIEKAENAYIIASWVKLPGTLFLGLIQMVVIPLVISSIILGISQSGEIDFLKRLGLRIVPYFIMTTIVSITIGLILVSIIKPGEYISQDIVQEFQKEQLNNVDAKEIKTFEELTIPQRIANLIPTNIAQAFVEKNLLQIVIASIIIGIVLLTIPKTTAKPIIDLSISIQVITMKIISWAMIIAPYAVFGMLCDITIKVGIDALASMGVYVITVLLGLLCMLIFYMMIVTIIAKKSPLKFLSGIKEAQLLAFSTSSSAATMPFSIKCAEENLKIRPAITRFVIPLGATINMDGTALYQAIAAVFLVQLFGDLSGIELTTSDIILLMITTVGASIGTPATPGVGIVVLATILTGIGLHPAAIGFIIGVDRILDMCRTTVNVTGDLTATAIMERWLPDIDNIKHEIRKEEEKNKSK